MSYTNEDIRVALTRELTDERVALAAAYWLDASPHERWVPDGIILARYTRYAMAEIERLRAEVKRLREERRWISVKDRFPDHGVRVLMSNGLSVFIAMWNDQKMRFETPDGIGIFWVAQPTHWQPLPEPPKEG